MGYNSATVRFGALTDTIPARRLEKIWFSKGRDVPKGWGKEVHITNHIVLPGEQFPIGYSGKLLVYDRKGAVSSMHFHTVKHETFYILKGEFIVWYYDPDNADIKHEITLEGDKVEIPPNNPHQVICKGNNGIIIEFASSDYAWDNYRIAKGDSQTKEIKRPCGCPTGKFE